MEGYNLLEVNRPEAGQRYACYRGHWNQVHGSEAEDRALEPFLVLSRWPHDRLAFILWESDLEVDCWAYGRSDCGKVAWRIDRRRRTAPGGLPWPAPHWGYDIWCQQCLEAFSPTPEALAKAAHLKQ